jgi:hypothetical protein
MARVIPEWVLENVLNPVEIALLVLAAHFHDVGMIPDAEEAARLRESVEYYVARDNWLIEYSGFYEALRLTGNEDSDPQDRERSSKIVVEFEGASFMRFLRDHHAQRLADYVKLRLEKDLPASQIIRDCFPNTRDLRSRRRRTYAKGSFWG